MAGDGSRWRHAQWEGLEVTLREYNSNSRWSSPELMIQEMENLSLLRHPNILLLMATCCGPSKHDLLLVVEPVLTYSLFQLLHQFEESFMTSHARKVDVALGITKGECSKYCIAGNLHEFRGIAAFTVNEGFYANFCAGMCSRPQPTFKIGNPQNFSPRNPANCNSQKFSPAKVSSSTIYGMMRWLCIYLYMHTQLCVTCTMW